jgi:hypothetical protein
MTLGTLLLSTFISVAPLEKDSSKVEIKIPETKYKTQITYDLGRRNIQYNQKISKNTFLFTEYPALKQIPQQPILKPKELKIGFKIKF